MATIPVVISPVQAFYRCVNVDLPDGGLAAKLPTDLAVSGRDALTPLVDAVGTIIADRPRTEP